MFVTRRRTISLGFGLAFSTTLALAGCNGGAQPTDSTATTGASPAASSGGQRIKIGFANLTEDIPFAVRVREGIEKAAKANNVELVTADNKLDGAIALANADNFLTQGVQGVIEFQTDEKFGKVIMEKFNAAEDSRHRHRHSDAGRDFLRRQ